jgi:uncharacterized protein RhaS with RHS repeats
LLSEEAKSATHNRDSFAYSYDVAGNLTTTQTVGSDVITTTNVYDGINRPIEVSQSGAAVRGLKANYAYSPTGEVTSIQRYLFPAELSVPGRIKVIVRAEL